MAQFYNPYHFVPVSAPNKKHSIQRDAFREKVDRESSVTHERFVPQTHSGRLLVRLTTVTPTAVGNKQHRPHEKEYATVEPYLVDGVPAIPGSAIRGMIGSVIEAATNAPLRVLNDPMYSFRRKMERSLSAIGLIVQEKGELKLRPMCLPTLESKDGGRSFEAPAGFREIFPTPQFKVFFGDAKSIRESTFAYRTHLADTLPVEMPVKQLAWSGSKVLADRTLHLKGGRYLVAQDPDTRDPGRPGRVRVLGCWPEQRKKEIPGSKKHELWIPEPGPGVRALPISEVALNRFAALADERTKEDANLPFEPLDTRPPRTKDSPLRLAAGDMVYFDVDEAGKEVVELSFSAIWRARVEDRVTHEAATAWKFFGKIDPELLPANEARKTISAAELLLGFVDDEGEASRRRKAHAAQNPPREFADDAGEASESGLALASRLRFADALPASGDRESLLLPQAALKILGSPKPPCPALYFRPKKRSGYIEKSQLNPAEHEPHGRKWYLHAKSEPGARPWVSNNTESKTKGQKNLVEPIAADKAFFWHIDFDNLTGVELGLLLFALEPGEAFCHKIGMGKPLGLGSVKLEILGFFPVDRLARYSTAGLRADRYGSAILTDAGRGLRNEGSVPSRYSEEFAVTEGPDDLFGQVRTCLDESGSIVDAAKRALLMLGDYGRAPLASEVRYPTTADQRDKESEHFKWFVFNDGHRERGQGMRPNRQSLPPLDGARELPSLTELEGDDQKTRRGW